MAAVASLIGLIFRSAWRIFRVLWVCRVPAVSALAGGALMILVPQAVDLFADTGLSAWRWGWFFFSLFIWAWLVAPLICRPYFLPANCRPVSVRLPPSPLTTSTTSCRAF